MTHFMCRCLSALALITVTTLLAPAASTAAGIVINGGSPITNYRQVTLAIDPTPNATQMSLRADFGTWSPWEPLATTKQWTLTDPNGNHYVSVKFKDALDNQTIEYSDNIYRYSILDLSFHSPFGTTLTGTGKSVSTGALVQPDGKIIQIGTIDFATDTDLIVMRRNSDGTTDTTFNAPYGYYVTSWTLSNESANAIARQADGKLVVVGNYSGSADSSYIMVMRLNSNGTLDETFNAPNGIQILGGTGVNSGNAVAIQPADGKILVASSYDFGNGDTDLTVTRLNANGSVDTGFGTNGWFVDGNQDSNLADSARGIAVQADGRIVVVGEFDWGNESDGWVLRLTSSGSYDTSFNQNGYIFIGGSGNDVINGVAIQPADGKVVVTGTIDWGIGDTDLLVYRFNTDGTEDTTFGSYGGGYFLAGGTLADKGQAVAIQPDGKILLTGSYDFGRGDTDLYLARLDTAGYLDPALDNGDDFLYGDIGSDSGRAVAVQADGRIVVAGAFDNYENSIAGASTALLLLRAHGTTSPLTVNKNGNGTVTTYPGQLSWSGNTASGNFIPDSSILLTANADSDSVFGGWGGACSGSATTCQTTMSTAKSVIANFILKDTVPTAFSFSDQTGVALNTEITSNAITVSGINSETDISISGGTYAINGGSFTDTAGKVANGATVTVKLLSSSSGSTTSNATLTIGGISDTFSVTTVSTGKDTTPDSFAFADEYDVPLGSAIISAPITVTGINFATPISVVGGSYSKNNGSFVTTAGTVLNGDTIRVKTTSATSFMTAKNVILTIGGISDTFVVVTAAKDVVPDPVSFINATNAPLYGSVVSAPVAITGTNAAAPISIVGGKYSVNGGAFTAAAGTVPPNASLRVQVTAAGSYNTPTNAVVTIGGNPATFTVTTLAIVSSSLAESLDNPLNTNTSPLIFSTTGAVGWFGQNAMTQIGSDAAQSGKIGSSQQSSVQTTVIGPCSISFFQKISSEPTYDTLKFSIDGVVKSTISGETNWQQKTFAITTAGSHSLTWTYSKNGSGQKGQDAAWIDNLTVSQYPLVHVLTPNDGEKFASGGSHSVVWHNIAGAASYKLSYTTNSAAVPVVWTTIATGVTGSSYDWTVPVLAANKTACKLKVEAYNTAGALIGSDISDRNFTIHVLKLNSPSGGVVGGVATNINYTISGITSAASVKFYYSLNSGTSWLPITTITDNKTPGTYNQPWTPPSVASAKTTCKVKVELRNAAGGIMTSAVSAANFSILPY